MSIDDNDDNDFELAGMSAEELAESFLEDCELRVANLKTGRVCVKKRAEVITPSADDLSASIAAGLASGSDQATEHQTALMLAHLILVDPEGLAAFVDWWEAIEDGDEPGEDEDEDEDVDDEDEVHVVEED